MVTSPRSPIPFVSTVILDEFDRVVLVQRGRKPGKGLWSIPGGKVKTGETLTEAAAREAWEETRLQITVEDERWVLTVQGDDGNEYEIHCFEATTDDRELIPGDDAADARWVPVDALGEYPLTDGLEERIRVLISERMPPNARR